MSRLTPKTKSDLRTRRHKRIRAKVKGSSQRPRLSVFRSNKYIYAQIIDDEKQITLASSSSKNMKGKGMTVKAEAVGKDIAKSATEKGVTQVVFDRGGFTYTGLIKALAEAARSGGLSF